MNRIESFRDFYARLVVAAAGANGAERERLVTSFRAVPREKFVGEGPWSAFTLAGYVPTLINDPAILYQDITLKLPDVEGPINNGQPSLHAACLAALSPEVGETGIHVGAGTGYYTAILAELVGAEGSVIAYEIEAALAGQTRRNLSSWPQVAVECRSGATGPLPQTDFIYVNAGATHPHESWLAALKANGRLLFPLTPSEGVGGMLLLRRIAEDAFKARFVCPAMFIPCRRAKRFYGKRSDRRVPVRQHLGGGFAARGIESWRQLLLCGRDVVAFHFSSLNWITFVRDHPLPDRG